MKQRYFSGYMALTTAIMVSVVMALLAISLSLLSVSGRSNGVAISLKQKSLAAAQGCLEQALLNLTLNSSYGGNETVAITSGTETVNCTIAPITLSGSNKTIKVQATLNDLTTNLMEVVDAATLNRVSLQETSTQ